MKMESANTSEEFSSVADLKRFVKQGFCHA